MMEEQFWERCNDRKDQIEQMEEGTKAQNDNEINGNEEKMEEASEIGAQEDSAQNSLNPDQIGDDETADPSEEPEKVQIYQKYDYRGRWEVPTIIYTQGQRLYGGEHSGILKGRKEYRLIKIDKKRTYRGTFTSTPTMNFLSIAKSHSKRGDDGICGGAPAHLLHTLGQPSEGTTTREFCRTGSVASKRF